jgi:hypothetical protein
MINEWVGIGKGADVRVCEREEDRGSLGFAPTARRGRRMTKERTTVHGKWLLASRRFFITLGALARLI